MLPDMPRAMPAACRRRPASRPGRVQYNCARPAPTWTKSLALSGRVGLVTGGGRGIGRAVALALARAGATLALAARTRIELQAVAAEIGRGGAGTAAIREVDLADPDSVACRARLAARRVPAPGHPREQRRDRRVRPPRAHQRRALGAPSRRQRHRAVPPLAGSPARHGGARLGTRGQHRLGGRPRGCALHRRVRRLQARGDRAHARARRRDVRERRHRERDLPGIRRDGHRLEQRPADRREDGAPVRRRRRRAGRDSTPPASSWSPTRWPPPSSICAATRRPGEPARRWFSRDGGPREDQRARRRPRRALLRDPDEEGRPVAPDRCRRARRARRHLRLGHRLLRPHARLPEGPGRGDLRAHHRRCPRPGTTST